MPDSSTGDGSGEQRCGAYQLVDRLSQPGARVEHWHARGQWGPAEVYWGDSSLMKVARGMPGWGPFPVVEWGETDGRAWVAVPGRLVEDLSALGRRLEPGATLAFGWHVIAAVAELHENGSSHGALGPLHAGLDELGSLTVRPALGAMTTPDPDPTATAQATDCLALGRMLDALRVDLIDDDAVRLLMRGLRREKARLRLQPGRAVRQAMAAVLARHPDYEQMLVESLGPSWKLSRLPSAPPPVRPRLSAQAPWARNSHDDETPISSPAQVFLGQGTSSDQASETGETRPQPAAAADSPHGFDPAATLLPGVGEEHEPLEALDAGPAGNDDDDSDMRATAQAAAVLGGNEGTDDPGTYETQAPPGSAQREDDTALQPVPDSAAADIVETPELDPQEDDGTYLAAGSALVSVDAMPLAREPDAETGDDPDTDVMLGEDSSEPFDPVSVDGATFEASPSEPSPLDPSPLDPSDEDIEILSAGEPLDDLTADTSLPLDLPEPTEDPSSVLAGLAEVHHGRDEIPLAALELPVAEEVDDDDSIEWDDPAMASDEFDAQEVAAAAEEAEAEAARLAAEKAAAELAEIEARVAAEAAAAQAEKEAMRLAKEQARQEAARLEAEQTARREAEAAARVRAQQATAEAEQREAEMLERAAALEREALARKLGEEARMRAVAAASSAAPTDRLAEAGLDSLDRDATLPDRDREDSGGQAPRWAGAKGVTGDSSREKELGKGKWLEQARSLDEVAAALPSGQARDMDMDQDDGSGPVLWVVLGIAAVLVLAFLGWRVAGSNAAPTETVAEAPPPAATTAVAEALPEAPSVTVVSQPAGARVMLDGAPIGVAPVLVPVPTDAGEHELCLELDGARSCRQLTGQALASSDPYIFPLD